MRGTFIISGMPRARTAWLANFMTYGSVLCEHEMLSKFKTPEECAEYMRQMVEDGVVDAIGMSDSGAVLFQDALKAALPEARWVIIRRSVDECQKSFKNEHGIDVDLWDHKRKVDDAIMNLSPLVVDFEDIDSRLDEIRSHCVGGAPKPISHSLATGIRDQMLKGFDVKLTDNALRSGCARIAASPILQRIEPAKYTEAMVKFAALMAEILGPVPDALRFWNELLEVCDIYDHTVDGDGIDVAKTHRAFSALMLSWPSNPFLHKNWSVLVPVLSAGISAWRYGPRSASGNIYSDVANTLIRIIYGQAGVDKWMPLVWEMNATILADDTRKDGD